MVLALIKCHFIFDNLAFTFKVIEKEKLVTK